jgi:hypothetical protein
VSEAKQKPEASFSEKPQLPFVGVLLAYAFGGSVFVAMNVPMLIAVLDPPKGYSGLSSLIDVVLVSQWAKLLKDAPQATLAVGVAFLSVVSGFMIKPFDQLFAQLVTAVFSSAARFIAYVFGWHAAKRFSHGLFMPSKYAAPEYARTLSWLMRNREPRAHWEYELFLYLIHWSLAFNALVFVGACAWLLRFEPSSWLAAFAFALFLSTFVLFALAKSRVMGATHEYYMELAAADRQPQDGPPS